MRLRVATFNAENLFLRYPFGQETPGAPFVPSDLFHRQITADALRAIRADVVALQEIESLQTLKKFNAHFLAERSYRYAMCIEGNDSRGIDVALLSRFPLACLRTHQFETEEGEQDARPLFPRDCLEAQIALPGGRLLTLFINHFKSMAGDRDGTMSRRRAQAQRVAQIVEERFPDPADADWIVLGDLNDYPPSPGLEPLLSRPYLENVVARQPEPERWTHHWAFGDEYRQLDYLLVSQRLAAANPEALPEIERRGLPGRAARAEEERFPGVGFDHPKASDHCPVVWEFSL